MKNIVLVAMMIASGLAFAKSKELKSETPVSLKEHMQMHEQMMKAHQEAADCLKSGKSEEECHGIFRAAMKEVGGMEMCSGMHKHEMHKHGMKH